MACHSLFFITYQGLRSSIYAARDKQRNGIRSSRDLQDCANDFLSSFVAGIVYRAGTIAYFKSPVELRLTPKMVALTGLKMGIVCTVLESIDDYVRSSFAK